ncbi:MAG: preprotein translocase subunit SecE [Planctomycetaceae bacterium]|nr:preprotein translocase subunit SecE [Planctomycetaceae bacterium]
MRDLFKELFRVRRYKNNQGRLVRRLTMFGVWAVIICGAYKFTQLAFDWAPLLREQQIRYIVGLLFVMVGMWFGYRLVHWPVFADFLVSVESEMVKVSWPGKAELYSSTIVVLVMFAILSAMIYLFDLVWVSFFNLLGILG